MTQNIMYFFFFRNKISLHIKELLFLRESVKRNKDQPIFLTNGSFCCTWEHEVPFCSTWEHEVPIYVSEKEQLVPFVVFGNTKFLFI